MASRNRQLSEQRDDFLLETNFDDDGALTRAHFNNNRISNNSAAPEPRPRAYRSNYSIDRYSDAGRSHKEGQIKDETAQEHSVSFVNQKHKQIIRKRQCENFICSVCVTQSQSLITPTLKLILCCVVATLS